MSKSKSRRTNKPSPFVKIAKQVGTAFSDLSSGLNTLITRPFADLKRSFGGNGKGIASLMMLPFALLVALISVLAKILLSPADLGVGLFRGNKTTILIAIPCCLVLATGIYVYRVTEAAQQEIRQLKTEAGRLFLTGNYDQSVEKFDELIARDVELSNEAKFDYVRALTRVESRQAEAQQELKKLAPDLGKGTGYQPAHLLRAINIARDLKQANPRQRERLKWHLDNGGDSNDPTVQRAWAEYYLSVGEEADAISHMERAATIKPEYFVLVASIYQKLDRTTEYKEALQKARNFFSRLVDDKPENLTHRAMLSDIFLELSDEMAAERTLLAGRDHVSSQELNGMLAEFYLRLFYTSKDDDFRKRFVNLKKCLASDLNYVDAYQALIQLYRDPQQSDDQREQVVAVLEQSINSDKTPALAHFALSNILYTESKFDQSRFHMEQAFKLDPDRFAIVANNLAWILAHDEEAPDLDRALSLSQSVVKNHPYDGRLRDTYATILKKLERYDEALAEFARALPTVSNKPKVHQHMAEIYEKLGKPKLAESHRNRAQANK